MHDDSVFACKCKLVSRMAKNVWKTSQRGSLSADQRFWLLEIEGVTAFKGCYVKGTVQAWNPLANEGTGVVLASKPASLPSGNTYPTSLKAGQVVTLLSHTLLDSTELPLPMSPERLFATIYARKSIRMTK